MHHALAWPAIHWQVFLLSTSFKRREIALFPNSEKRSEGLLKTRAEGSHASFFAFLPCVYQRKGREDVWLSEGNSKQWWVEGMLTEKAGRRSVGMAVEVL